MCPIDRAGLGRCVTMENMGVVVITDAGPRWGREYETVAARVQKVLGAALTRVDHIGSTSALAWTPRTFWTCRRPSVRQLCWTRRSAS